jgi:hypothetical protein
MMRPITPDDLKHSKGSVMNAYRTMTLATLFSLVAVTAQAEYGPYTYPETEPEGPLSGMGEYRRTQSMRRFYEQWDAYYRAAEADAEQALREFKSGKARARKGAREAGLAEAKARNLTARFEKNQARMEQASDLLVAIREGTVNWPTLLRKGWAKQRLDEAVALLPSYGPATGADCVNFKRIASELRTALASPRFGGSHAERLEATRTVMLLQMIATMPEIRALAQH